MSKISTIEFIDLVARDKKERAQIKVEIRRLTALKSPSQIELDELERLHRIDFVDATTKAEIKQLEDNPSRTPDEEKELERLNALTSNTLAPAQRDPIFITTRYEFGRENDDLAQTNFDMDDKGKLTVDQKKGADLDRSIARIALVLGFLDLRRSPFPRLDKGEGKYSKEVVPKTQDGNYALFGQSLFAALGLLRGRTELAVKVLGLIASAVDIEGDRKSAKVSAREFARVFEKLVEHDISSDDPNLKPKVEEYLGRVQEIGEERPFHETTIDLPDLEATTDFQVLKDNVSLFGAMIFASMLDELRAFQVVDRLVESARRGEISLIKGDAGTQLYKYWREAPNRMSDIERQTFYAMTLGIPTGQPGVTVNTEFQDLWLRFVSSVSSLVRESRVDQLLRSQLPFAINQQRVKKAARDLTSNMSLYGYGMAFYAAADLQKQINEMIRLLDDKELKSVFGARDMWGVIDQVAQTELGGARNSSKYRTLATCGAIITKWLADNLNRLRDPTMSVIDLNVVSNPPGRPSGQKATSHPNDYDLVNACELWLADSAMGEDRVEQLSQPRESPQQPSRPITIPSMARELLEGAGLGFEMGAGNGNVRRHNGRGPGAYQGY